MKTLETKDVEKYLLGLEKKQLVNLLLDQAEADAHFKHLLALKASEHTGRAVDFSHYRKSIKKAFRVPDFMDYYEAPSYVPPLDDLTNQLRDLVEKSNEPSVIELIEDAIEEMVEFLEHVDDSDGEFGSILDQLNELHIQSCTRFKPEPVALAQKLFDAEFESSFDEYHDVVNRYAEVLGEKGLGEYRRLAKEKWDQIPDKPLGSKDDFDYTLCRLERILEFFARKNNDLEAVLQIRQKDLSALHRVYGLTQVLLEMGKTDEALDWAERGIRAYPATIDRDLYSWLEEEYHRRGRHEDAIALAWKRLEQWGGLESYRHLKKQADKNKTWPHWREKALEHIRSKLLNPMKDSTQKKYYFTPDHSVLVEIFCWEKDYETAWKEANKGGCRLELWDRLAQAREKEHPLDSIQVYQKIIHHHIEHPHKHQYDAVLPYLQRIRTLYQNMKTPQNFTAYFTKLCQTYHRKRNLMAVMDRFEKSVSR